MIKSAGAGLLVIFALACGQSPPAEKQSDAGNRPVIDGGQAPVIGDWVRVTTDQGPLQGQWIHSFDHRVWWHGAEEVETLALFDWRALTEFPNDASMVFVRSDEVSALEVANPPADFQVYREAMREKGVLLSRPPLSGIQYVITGHESYHLEEDGFGDWSWDLIKLNPEGSRLVGDGSANEDFVVWDESIYLPTSGTVVDVIRDQPDNVPGYYEDQAVNNMVGIHLYGNFYLYLLHQRQGSIPMEIQVGDFLPAGTMVGTVGNSGVTLEPHLHVTAYYYDDTADPPRSWGVPAEFADLFFKSAWAAPTLFSEYVDPAGGSWIAAEEF